MKTIFWISIGLMFIVFSYSGFCKTFMNEKSLIRKGQTGIKGLPYWFIKFIGVSEIVGAIGLILPLILGHQIHWVCISAICLGLIMIPAALIHYRFREYMNVLINLVIFLICIYIAYYVGINPGAQI